jgi:CheY-like chemotaxis protein
MNPKPKMFIAEDSPTLLPLLARLFDNEFDVVEADSGSDALAKISLGGPFDIAIMDMVMPVENMELGLEDAGETGLRLIDLMLKEALCSRFVILTVRWNLEERLSTLIGERARYSGQAKQQT